MNEHSLDDLIIGAPSPTVKKSKSLLAIIALIVIILLIGILLSRMILGPSGDDILLSESNKTEFVSPDLIPMENPSSQTDMVTLKPINKEKLPKKQVEKVKQNLTKPRNITHKPIVVKEQKPKISPKKPKKPVLKTKPKIVKKSAPRPKELFAEGKPTYFIQIGAFNRDPNPRFIQKLKDAGLRYVIHKNEKTRRVRVGPYGSYTEAKSALQDVNSSIGIMGFVVKQK